MAQTSRATGGGRGTRTRPAASGTRTRGRAQPAESAATPAGTVAVAEPAHDDHHRHARLDVPVLVPELHVHHLSVPAAGPRLPRPRVPSGNMLWLGGLAALAVTGVIGWPVAAVVAAGTYVAERRARSDVRQELSEHEATGAGAAAGSRDRTG